MKKYTLTALMLSAFIAFSQKISWTYSTPASQWVKGAGLALNLKEAKADLIIYTDQKLHKIEGFGACFNEMGWEALLTLPEQTRTAVLKDFFSKEGMNFTWGRMPLGSNDYSFSYYSYNDVPEDFEMKNFNIDRDRYILIPYIKAAMKVNPQLKIWASPWTPPVWMKVNNHYAMGAKVDNKRMAPGKMIRNNATAFRMEDGYLDAYSLYFSKFVKAYEKEGIPISRVMVQNEIVYQPHWQSCTWRPEDIGYFIGRHLGPRFQTDSIKTEIWLGTVNTSNVEYVPKAFAERDAAKYIKGIGIQWDAKKAVEKWHKDMPQLPIMQTESECGGGENNWKSAEYTWSLIQQYISNGANSYMYWNPILETGISTWGWKQNMLITTDPKTKTVKYNPEYYLMKHVSHFVLPGAVLLGSSAGKNHLAFQNPNGEIVLLAINNEETDQQKILQIGGKSVSLKLKGKSINSFVFNQ